jgi:hypothetical protein
VHPADAVLDEHQDVQPFQQHGADERTRVSAALAR